MEQSLTCPKCQNNLEATDLFCGVCGYNLKNSQPSTSLSKQLSVYLISFLLPPIGLVPAIKYLRQNDKKSKQIGIAAIILTLLSLLLSIWLLSGMMKKFSEISTGQMDGFDNLGY